MYPILFTFFSKIIKRLSLKEHLSYDKICSSINRGFQMSNILFIVIQIGTLLRVAWV